MKKLSYLISSGGRFHNFEVAKVLYSRNQLHKIISGYPWFKLKREKIPKSFVECFGLFGGLIFLHRKMKYQSKYITENLDILNLTNIDRMSLKHINQADVFLSLSGTGLNTGKEIKKNNKIYICERSSSHILEQQKILKDEYKSLDLQSINTNKWVIERELEEYNVSDIILVPSLFAKKSFENYLPNMNKVHAINFGINLQNFYPVHPNTKDNGYFDILFIGLQSIRKGLHYLIEAFHKFKHPHKRLHIVGAHSEDINFFSNKIKHEKIYVYGTINQLKLKDIISKSHVFVLPSLEEGMAVVVLQALACGCPVIVSENTGSAEFVIENKCGFVVPIRNSQIIADKLTLLSDNRQLLEEFSNNALKISKKNSWENYVDKLDQLVEKYKKDRI